MTSEEKLPDNPPIRNEAWLRKRIRDLESEARGLYLRLEDREEFHDQVVAAISAQEPYPSFAYCPPSGTGVRPIIVVLELSDLHIGEVIRADETEGFNRFDWETAQAGMFGIIEDFLQWVEVHRARFRIDGCAIICKGDYVSGDIHEELRTTNEWPLPVQTAKAGWLLGEVFRILAGHFEKVMAYEVGADNHGRLQTKPQAKRKAANSMSFLVQHIANAAAGRCHNFQPIIAEGMKHLAEINGHSFLIEHGDTVKGWMGIPFYGIARQAGKEAMRRMGEGRGFDYYSIGHFHVPCWDQRWFIMNGSLSGTTEFDHSCGRHALPCQVAYLVHPAYGVFDFTSFLRRDVKERLIAGLPLSFPPEKPIGVIDPPPRTLFVPKERMCAACERAFFPDKAGRARCIACRTRICALPSCGKTFILDKWNTRRTFCSTSCSAKHGLSFHAVGKPYPMKDKDISA